MFDVGRLACAVVSLNHHAAVVHKARENCQRGVPVEDVVGIEIGNMFVGLGETHHLHVGVETEYVPHVDGHSREL